VFGDPRGYFKETFRQTGWRVRPDPGLSCRITSLILVPAPCADCIISCRTLKPKLVTVLRGEVFDVAVDIRLGSPTFGKWVGEVLSDRNHRQLYIPEGFAHGFCVLSEEADFIYKCTDFYAPKDDHGIIWSDPVIGIEWPVKKPILSEKDRRHRSYPPCRASNCRAMRGEPPSFGERNLSHERKANGRPDRLTGQHASIACAHGLIYKAMVY
jgi:dTDP-4-dehydrorhamnose 3,5-epimerase